MADFPSLPLFTDAWIADTKHLTRLERGTYHDLLVLMWRTPGCRVPNDNAWLARRLSMTLVEVETELRPIIREFCRTDGNWISQKRLTKVKNYVTQAHGERSDRAKAFWRNKKKNASNPITINGGFRNGKAEESDSVLRTLDAMQQTLARRKEDLQ